MKAINWVVIITLICDVVANFVTDLPKEAIIGVAANGVVLIAYIWHKTHPTD
jgi:hypothetical protein